MTDSLGTTAWQFDLLNRLTSVTDPYGQTVTNGYDPNGNRVSLIYPGNKVVNYGFDTLNRMIALTNWLNGVVTYTYDNRGNLVVATNANNTTASYTYDAADRLVGLTNETAKDLGRGGALHKSIQERIQTEARKLGFMADVEERVNKKSNQAADLILQCGETAIAVEIAISTSVTHEFQNVQKCLAAGFTRLAVITPRTGRLDEIKAAVEAGLGPEMAAKVSYHSADDFIAHLHKLAAEIKSKPVTPTLPGERVSHGLRVRRHVPQQTPEELKQKEDVAIRVMTEAMRQKSR
jgi:YD repeat-containing protein